MRRILLFTLCFIQSVYCSNKSQPDVHGSDSSKNTQTHILTEADSFPFNQQEQQNTVTEIANHATTTTNATGNESPTLGSVSATDPSPSGSPGFSAPSSETNQSGTLTLEQLYQTDENGIFIYNSEEAQLGRLAFEQSYY